MKAAFRVLEIKGGKVTLKARPRNITIPLYKVQFVTVNKSFARIKYQYLPNNLK